MNWWSDFILALVVMTLMYYLALAFIGEKGGWKALFSIMVLTMQAFCFRDIYPLPSAIYVLIYLIIFTLCLFLIQKINIIHSLLGALLTIITSIIGSLLLASPLLLSIGIKIPIKPNGWEWIALTFAELIIPLTVLIILKLFKISIRRFIPDKES